MADPAAIAALIRQRAAAAGLGPGRAGELVDAAYSESGLNPQATNRSSGAAGLFQLLSPGYVNRAKQLGGVYNPAANISAILPDYVNYWKQHPGAAPGEAARDVERSGMGAGFYVNSASEKYGGGAAPFAGAAPSTPPTAPASPPQGSFQTGLSPRAQLGLTLAEQIGKPRDLGAFTQALLTYNRASNAAPAATAGPPAPSMAAAPAAASNAPPTQGPAGMPTEAFYDPLGSYDNGQFGGPIGGHSDHVHISGSSPQELLAAITLAQKMGLSVRENPYVDPVDPVHVQGSYHYRDFPGTFGGKKLGEAIDVSGDPNLMAAFYRAVVHK